MVKPALKVDQDYPTFEDFCEKEYGISRSRAHRLIEAAEVKASVEMSHMGLKISNERQARALKDVPEEERDGVWRHARALTK